MDFSEQKEQIIEKFKETSQKISENDTVIQLVEAYKGLSPLVQKCLLAFVALIFVYVLYSIPSGYIASASDYEARFQENRDMIRGLFKTARMGSGGSSSFTGQSYSTMKSSSEGKLRMERVMDTQQSGFLNADKALPRNAVPTAIRQEGMTISLKQLNIEQVAGLSEKLSSLHPNTKLAGLSVRATKADPHYFDVSYTLSSLSLSAQDLDAPKAKTDKKNKKNRFKKKK